LKSFLVNDGFERQRAVDLVADGTRKGIETAFQPSTSELIIDGLVTRYQNRQASWADLIIANSVLSHPEIAETIDLGWWRQELSKVRKPFFGDEQEHLVQEVEKVNLTLLSRGYPVDKWASEMPFVRRTKLALQQSLAEDLKYGPGPRVASTINEVNLLLQSMFSQAVLKIEKSLGEGRFVLTYGVKYPCSHKKGSPHTTGVNVVLGPYSLTSIALLHATSLLRSDAAPFSASNGIAVIPVQLSCDDACNEALLEMICHKLGGSRFDIEALSQII